MNGTAAIDPRLEIIWKFIRGYISPQEFEQWVYAELSLEELLGENLYLDTISADYSSKLAVADLQNTLENFARENSNLRCECITYRDLHVGYITDNCEVFFLDRLELKAINCDLADWLSAHQCPSCNQWWLIAKLDVFNLLDSLSICFLKRLSKEESDRILGKGVWPKDFSNLRYLKRLQARHM